MIYKLQRKFVLISTVSVLGVVALVFSVIVILNISSMNKNLDILADQISEGGGIFPMPFEEFVPGKIPPENKQRFDFITSETPFATRHFTVFFDGYLLLTPLFNPTCLLIGILELAVLLFVFLKSVVYPFF